MESEEKFKLENQHTMEGVKNKPEFQVLSKDIERGEVVLGFGLKEARFFLDRDGRVKTAFKDIPAPIKHRMLAQAAAILKEEQKPIDDEKQTAKQESLPLE